MISIVLQNLVKTFGQTRAVDDISLSFEPGTIYGLLGPNGAGKTTTIRMIMDIIRPDTGSITINENLSPSQARDIIGYMPEERGLYSKMKVVDLLAYFAALKGVPSGQVADKVSEWLCKVELDDKRQLRVEQLSRGMQQKLQFALTAISDPEILILDEPFSGLDPVNLELIRGLITELRDRGCLIILSTHAMHEAQNLCGHIVMINQGSLVLNGTIQEIREAKDTRLVEVQLDGDTQFLHDLEYVINVEKHDDGQWQITLSSPEDAPRLLGDLAGNVHVISYQVKQPSLHEIFVGCVKGESL